MTTDGRHLLPEPGAAHEPSSEVVPASTVVLVRDSAVGLEVLLLRRDSKLAFAAGVWVFPGGRLDPGDYVGGGDPEAHGALEQAARNAAVREAKEEAGLELERDDLLWFAHWTPPPGQIRRFATWFFLAGAPDTDVVVDDGEIRDHLWVPPTAALALHTAGEIELITPTWMTLHTLSQHADAASVLAWARANPPSVYVTRLEVVEGGRIALWDGDAAYVDADLDHPGARHRLLMPERGAWTYVGDPSRPAG